MSTTDHIIENEKALLLAIKNRDLHTLDILLHDELLFNLPNGQTISKKDDLDTHQSGLMKIFSIEAQAQQINIIGDTAIVAVTIALQGQYVNDAIDGNFRYLRVWKQFNEQWKIIAGSCTALS